MVIYLNLILAGLLPGVTGKIAKWVKSRLLMIIPIYVKVSLK
ncbi:hypothetical protein [uncultured Gammaproteobacteria bacterium]|nr:hypothetical protein [uncultured Gammaproteobacteria bacterium]CAC9584720.1 hypothetical protein [uncultured Gammaproteobacteria bacterium]CAC9647274.1 hypothetical protein [uncultured Gammaproteobacteria bacterium]CAC9652787.1 hypothetical protein [uncultured Gammaproteobacteria bacterium]CAC9987033.1 hypothetical protein [uncultured Gammaproteobacteria bacterium]